MNVEELKGRMSTMLSEVEDLDSDIRTDQAGLGEKEVTQIMDEAQSLLDALEEFCYTCSSYVMEQWDKENGNG